MTLLSRFVRLVRANVNHYTGRSRADPPDAEPWEEGPKGHDTNRAHQRPELARYYAALELPYGAGAEEVRAARKRLIKLYHPDRHARDPEREATATEVLKAINHAHNELLKHLEGGR